jgi:MoaA/NifB/PqqE/SkfB family radical SAM enzyme
MTPPPQTFSLYYRGPLSSCNYHCGYCPFAKHVSSREELQEDEVALDRFVRWLEGQREARFRILFTPWGEALIRRWYREAMIHLSSLRQVERVAAQTNLTGNLDWLGDLDPQRAALWITFHPSQIGFDAFMDKIRRVDGLGLRHSVGLVGLSENLFYAERLKRELPPNTTLWINAYKSEGPDYYEASEIAAFSAIDPTFGINKERHASRGESCWAGERSFFVDGSGDVRPCHFVDEVRGNLHRDDFDQIVAPTRCPNSTCGCYIGYVHMKRLGLYSLYGDGLMERIPQLAPEMPSRLKVLA